jgi:hypothetical protein
MSLQAKGSRDLLIQSAETGSGGVLVAVLQVTLPAATGSWKPTTD